MKIIINADDLGYSGGTNDIIFELLSHQRITSTTLLANGPAFDDAVRRIPDYGRFSFGVHLNLTEFSCLTRAQVFFDAGIIDEKGIFTGQLSSNWPGAGLSIKIAVLREWEEQVTKILDYGVRISHFDSHHHIHTLPQLFTTLKKLQKKFGLRKVRGTFNWDYGEKLRSSPSLLLKKKIWHLALRTYYRTSTTDYFTEFSDFVESQETCADIQGTWELMCHPGQPYFPGQKFAVKEKELLWSDWAQRSPGKIELISYNEL